MTPDHSPRLPFVVLNGTLDAFQAVTRGVSAIALSALGGHPIGVSPPPESEGFTPPAIAPEETETASTALASALNTRAKEALSAYKPDRSPAKGLEAPKEIPAPKTPPRELGPDPFKP
ncbi:hypothetical protein [Parvularcula dongshanensis]|uniref:Uncharacterized protein n=1 Tax=Parvularcula dongshanensis TaxID=1173995 RepID=A0A840I6N2_9PROT|nr:hypothetical protein [Parvularcula dongshanensis]MBB4659965.1 hypothetical protein [Parvularcula dongshanensis]